MNKIKFDTYTLIARMFPSIITLVPFFILWFFVRNDNQFLNLEKYLLSMKFVGTITLSLVILYLNSLIIRQISKYFEKKYFIEAKGFPTTYLMMYNNSKYSDEFKTKYRVKVKELLNINLLSKDEEANDPIEGKKRLDECTKQIILLLKDGYLVKSHNIWYGFSRNIIGGCIIACFFNLASIVVGLFLDKKLTIIASILFVIYLLILIFRKAILVYNAEAYAKQLISEFMQKSLEKISTSTK